MARALCDRFVTALLIAAVTPLALSGASPGKVKITMISFGDDLEHKSWVKDYKQHYNSKAKIEESFGKLKEQGFSVIYWRMLWEGAPDDEIDKYSYRVQAEEAQMKKEFENTPYAWDPHELGWPIAVAHRLGMKLYAWIVPHNMGAPPGAYAELGFAPSLYSYPGATIYETQFPYQFKFVREHPEYQLVDRKGKRPHYGVLEWAYPEARRYWIGLIKTILDKYDVDGIYMDTRTECMAPELADQFGFNEPIVEEFQRRYGVDIRKEDFDLENWRELRGAYFTLFLKEASAVIHGKGKPFSLGTARGDYIGFPLGNMKLEWRKWINEKIIDELHLDEQGWAWGTHGYGYLTDKITGRGLEPIDEMVRKAYEPLCREYGVKLYFYPALYSGKDAAWKQRVARMPEFDGIIDHAKFN
jgi:hypothetical protein